MSYGGFGGDRGGFGGDRGGYGGRGRGEFGGRGGGGFGGRGRGEFQGRGGFGRGSGEFRGGGRGGGPGFPAEWPPFPQPKEPPRPNMDEILAAKAFMDSMPAREPVILPKSADELQVALRPGFGGLGRHTTVMANHYRFDEIPTHADIYHYDVSIDPELKKQPMRRAVIKMLETQEAAMTQGAMMAYDGDKGLYTQKPLPIPPGVPQAEIDVRFLQPGEDARRERSFRVTIKPAHIVHVGGLVEYANGRLRTIPQDVLHALDVVLAQSPYAKFLGIKSSFYDPRFGRVEQLERGLESWRGYYQSVRLTQSGVVLVVDMMATAMVQAIPLPQYLWQLLGLRSGIAGLERLNDLDRAKARRGLKGIKVESTFTNRQGRRRNYKIIGITKNTARDEMFELTEGESTRLISIQQYYEEKRGITLQHPNLPCVQLGDRTKSKDTRMPMELLQIMSGQRAVARLTGKQVAQLLKAACIRPQERFHELQGNVLKLMDLSNDAYLHAFQCKVQSGRMIEPEARVLDTPLLFYGKGQTLQPTAGSWNMADRHVLEAVTVANWAAVCMDDSLSEDQVTYFLQQLTHNVNACGMAMGPPVIPCELGHILHAEESVRGTVRKVRQVMAERNMVGPLQLLVVILPDFRPEYGAIKRVGDTELSVPSQCMVAKHVTKEGNALRQYLANIALKINVKLGGKNVALTPPGPIPTRELLPRTACALAWEPTMVLGADVSHATAFERGSPSIAAVVASMDWPACTKYRAAIRAQDGKKEIIQDLYSETKNEDGSIQFGGIIREQLLAFYNRTGGFMDSPQGSYGLKPSRIIMYRDGVSDGQFKTVLLHELTAIRQACQSLQEDYCPRITFIVVQKRHHTRFNPLTPQDMCRPVDNVVPGLVVDQGVCNPVEHDFYMVSHVGIQGTSKPTHYYVLWDENNFSADEIQKLTNDLCYTYSRCTRSVSVAPPAYYAHLAAFRARHYLSREEQYSDTESTRSGSTTTTNNSTKLPQVDPFVQEYMFYC
eukprot:jgi/Mesvir1/3677/Mv14966-RA.1